VRVDKLLRIGALVQLRYRIKKPLLFRPAWRAQNKINSNKKTRTYISRICTNAPLQLICINFRSRVHIVDVINSVKFFS